MPVAAVDDQACPNYSARRASIGEIDAARLAGTIAATKALTASALAANVKAKGSQLETA